MNGQSLNLAGATLVALPSGALWWPEARLLAVGDLHLGRAERAAREGVAILPPYDSLDTLARLEGLVGAHAPATIVLLGDSFDDMDAAEAVAEDTVERIYRLAAGRRLIWIAGNHDPGPVSLPGTHMVELHEGPLVFRHIAGADAAPGEISAHFHPKLRLTRRGQHIARRCFLADARRIILPAFGTYTGGLDICDGVFDPLLAPDAMAWLTGRRVVGIRRDRASV